jgi:hypothetical protein
VNRETVQLADERDRLEDRLDELAELLVDADDSAAAASLKRQATNVESRLNGLDYLIAQYGESATITIEGMDAGAYARVDDRLADIRAERDGAGDAPGSRRNAVAAMGLVDAPFIDEPSPDFETCAEAITGLPVGAVRYLEHKTNALTEADTGNSASLRELLLEKLQED